MRTREGTTEAGPQPFRSLVRVNRSRKARATKIVATISDQHPSEERASLGRVGGSKEIIAALSQETALPEVEKRAYRATGI